MKKIIAIFAATVALVASTFAFDFEIGAKANLGKDLAKNETASDAIVNFNPNDEFNFGGSAYVHASIFPFLGVQIEPTIFNSKVTFSDNEAKTTSVYDALVLNVPVMYWSSLKIWRLGVGAGVGVNFSKDFDKNKSIVDNFKDVAGSAKESLSDFSIGLVAGADAKIYVTKHIGVVGSLRYVIDLSKKVVPIEVSVSDKITVDTGKSYTTAEIQRQFLYGSIGLEFKLF